MMIPTRRQTAWGKTGRFKQWTGAALGDGTAQKIKKGDQDVSGAHRSGNGNAGGSERDPGRAVRAWYVLGQRAFRRGQSRRRAQMVQPRSREGSPGRHS